jgi:hypothetical protein
MIEVKRLGSITGKLSGEVGLLKLDESATASLLTGIKLCKSKKELEVHS